MLRLATSFLRSPHYALSSDCSAELGFIEPWTLGGSHFFATHYSVGLPRYTHLPWTASRMHRAVSAVDFVYARLPSPIGYLACAIARKLHVPYWVSVHGDAIDVWEQASAATTSDAYRLYCRLRAQIAAREVTRALAHARATLFVGDALRSKFGEHTTGPTVAFAHYLHHADAVISDTARRPMGETPNLLFVGALTARKGVRDFLAAREVLFEMGLPVRCTIVGDGEDRALVQSVPGVRWTGWLSGELLEAEYSAADILVLPSRSGEGMPKVVIEAMARGIPVVATAVGGTTDLLGNGRGWLAPPGDAFALARALKGSLTVKGAAEGRARTAAAHMRSHNYESTQRLLIDCLSAAMPEALEL